MAAVERWTPIRELDRMERRMRRLFEDVGVFPSVLPASDILEASDEYIVELEVPGFAEEELDVEVTDHTLVVKGAREETIEKQEKDVLLHERLEREFERRFVLPDIADSEHVTATIEKGVLTLHVPKADDAKARKVRIGKK